MDASKRVAAWLAPRRRAAQESVDREATIKLAAAVLCARAAQFGDSVIADREPTPKQGDALMEAAVAYARAVRG